MTSTTNKNLKHASQSLQLEEIFKEIVQKNNKIKITLENLDDLIVNDLKLKIDDLSHSHLTTLPYMLINYIKKWPGWDKRDDYLKGTLDIDSWYTRFRQYIIFKMNFLITKTLSSVDKDLEDELKQVKVVTSSTQLTNRASFANFNLEIAGPATLLSNLVFWGYNENVSVEEHSERTWATMDVDHLINYPFIEVEFNSPELSFKRSFEPRINRYISGCADLVYEKPNFILGKHRINTTTSKFIFPLSLLESYIKVYKEVMYSQISPMQQTEVDVILDQFYKDMVDIKKDNSVAENRQVTFNIGRNIYKRSKKISNDKSDSAPGPSVIFNEVLLPKITSSFRYFTGMQEYDLDGKRIVSTKDNGNKMMRNFKPMISYKCTYCKVSFTGPQSRIKVLAHLQFNHKREQPLLCLLCKKSFEVMELAKQRWKCACQK